MKSKQWSLESTQTNALRSFILKVSEDLCRHERHEDKAIERKTKHNRLEKALLQNNETPSSTDTWGFEHSRELRI